MDRRGLAFWGVLGSICGIILMRERFAGFGGSS